MEESKIMWADKLEGTWVMKGKEKIIHRMGVDY